MCAVRVLVVESHREHVLILFMFPSPPANTNRVTFLTVLCSGVPTCQRQGRPPDRWCCPLLADAETPGGRARTWPPAAALGRRGRGASRWWHWPLPRARPRPHPWGAQPAPTARCRVSALERRSVAVHPRPAGFPGSAEPALVQTPCKHSWCKGRPEASGTCTTV